MTEVNDGSYVVDLSLGLLLQVAMDLSHRSCSCVVVTEMA